MNPKLIDGNTYWLGATWGTWSEKNQVFLLGNCFVRLADVSVWYAAQNS